MASFFLRSIFQLLFISFFFYGFSTQNLIQDTCRTSSNGDPNINFNFCTNSLQAAPASHCASLRDLGRISIRLISNNVTDTRCFVKNLLKNKTKVFDPYVKQCLSDCLELYSDAISSLDQAIRYYNSSRFSDANIQISSIMDAANTCEDGFKEKKGVVSPLTKRNSYTFELSAVSLSIMHILQTKVINS